MMTHEEALNKILSHACANLSQKEAEEKGYQVYSIDLHCCSFEVKAKPLGDYKYQILEVYSLLERPT